RLVRDLIYWRQVQDVVVATRQAEQDQRRCRGGANLSSHYCQSSERGGCADVEDALLRVVLTRAAPRLRIHQLELVPGDEVEPAHVQPQVAHPQLVKHAVRNAVTKLERLQTHVVRRAQEV